MFLSVLKRTAVLATTSVVAGLGLQVVAAQASAAAPLSAPPIAPISGPPGYAMQEPVAGAVAATGAPTSSASTTAVTAVTGSYTHTGAKSPNQDLPAGNGDVMTSATIYYAFWLPAGQTYEGTAAGDTNYENLLIQWARDINGSQFQNLLKQYYGNNGHVSGNASFGGSWVDTTAYPHTGGAGTELTDADIQAAVKRAVAQNNWTEDINHIVAVFTATGIQECDAGGTCTDSAANGFCAYHQHFSDNGHDTIYAFMGFDNFTHVAGKTCVAGDTSSDTDPNRGNYPNNDVSADAEINTLSHEVAEAETDPHPNDTWTAPSPEGEIGDACNYNFAPRNDSGADVYLNGHGYILQQEYSNAAHTCAIDYCPATADKVCAPTVSYTKAVDNATPQIGSTINYTLTLNNTNDSGAATNLTVTDPVPAGYLVTGESAPGATTAPTYDPVTNTVTVQYDTLPVHQQRAITISALVPPQVNSASTNCGGLVLQDLLGTAMPNQTTSPCATTTPTRILTRVDYTGPSQQDYDDAVTLSATLHDATNGPISGETLNFSLNGTETCSAVTDSSGSASCPVTPGEPAGPYMVSVTYTGSSTYDSSSTTAPFTVTLEDTTVSYTGPTTLTHGAAATLSGHLTEVGDAAGDGTGPIALRTLTFTLTQSGQTCNGVTDANGDASCTISSVQQPLGSGTVVVNFGGDAYYLPAAASASAQTVGEGLAVGKAGTIELTTDSGGHWSTVPSGTTKDLFGVFESPTNAYAVGQGGTILASSDGGATWATQHSGTTKDLRSISCPSPTHCYAVGQHGTVLQGDGTSWTAMHTPSTQDLNGVSCPSTSACVAAANDGSVFVMSGSTWARHTTVKSPKRLDSIRCVSTTTCVAVGDGGFAVGTSDGGTTWQRLTTGTTRELLGDDCSGTSCVAAGKDGTIVATADGGTTWSNQASGTVEDLTGVAMIDATHAFVVGHDGVIVMTQDGSTWSTQIPAVEPQRDLAEVSFA